MKNDKLNGSVDVLAQALRQVFTEAVESAVKPLEHKVDDMGKRLESVENGLKTTNENVQAQLAQNRKDISADIKKALKTT